MAAAVPKDEETPSTNTETFVISEKTDENAATVIECNGHAGDSKSSDSEQGEDEKEEYDDGEKATKENGREKEPVFDENGAISNVEPLTTDETAGDHGECNLVNCLRQFTAIELLNGKNKYGCSNCAKVSGVRANENAMNSVIANGSSSGDETKRRK